jgi:hypothetical protein
VQPEKNVKREACGRKQTLLRLMRRTDEC